VTTGAELVRREKARARYRERVAERRRVTAEAEAHAAEAYALAHVDDHEPSQSVEAYDLERSGHALTLEQWAALTGFDLMTRTYRPDIVDERPAEVASSAIVSAVPVVAAAARTHTDEPTGPPAIESVPSTLPTGGPRAA
jgi:hypothetical protein